MFTWIFNASVQEFIKKYKEENNIKVKNEEIYYSDINLHEIFNVNSIVFQTKALQTKDIVDKTLADFQRVLNLYSKEILFLEHLTKLDKPINSSSGDYLYLYNSIKIRVIHDKSWFHYQQQINKEVDDINNFILSNTSDLDRFNNVLDMKYFNNNFKDIIQDKNSSYEYNHIIQIEKYGVHLKNKNYKKFLALEDDDKYKKETIFTYQVSYLPNQLLALFLSKVNSNTCEKSKSLSDIVEYNQKNYNSLLKNQIKLLDFRSTNNL